MRKTYPIFAAIPIAGGILASAAVCAVMTRQTKPRQVVVITGGSRGLGFALASRFGRAGAKLVLSSRSADELHQARSRLLHAKAVKSPEDILLVAGDLTDSSVATRLIQEAIRTFGRVDVLINNAGIIQVGPVEDQSLDAYERAMSTNFFAALYTTYSVMPSMLARRSGSIVNIASIGGKFAMPHLLPYVASKFALVGFSEGLHAELRHNGIRVTTVCPGLMRTGGESHAHFTGRAEKEERWFKLAATTPLLAASVTRAANQIYRAVQKGRAEITITPQAWLAARFTGFVPEISQWLAGLANTHLLPSPLKTYR